MTQDPPTLASGADLADFHDEDHGIVLNTDIARPNAEQLLGST